MYHGKTIGVVIPAHNEAPSIAAVINDLQSLGDVVDHIVVCDNASSDGTADIAAAAGATVTSEPQQGYGAACLKALAVLTDVDWIVFVDGDRAMDAKDLPRLLDELAEGAQLVIGSRTLGEQAGRLETGALTPHQRSGNWLAAAILSAIWLRGRKEKVTDLGPFRAIAQSDLATLNMQDQAYGWTVEMQAKALDAGMQVVEVPVDSLHRIGVSKISGTWRGSLGASFGILGTLAKIGVPALWAQLLQSTKIESQQKDSFWKKPS